MSEWNRVPFSDLLVESRDGEWGQGQEIFGHQMCEVIRGTDFANLNDSNIELPLRWIPDHLVKRKKLEIGDILFEMAGGTAKQSTGRSALLRNGFFQHHQGYPILCASFCRHLRLDRKQYDPTFIYYLLQVLYAAGYMAVFNIQHTGVSRFQYTSFKKQTVLDVPILSTQRKIAAILSTYDDLIENNQRRIALLERMAEELYREWFVRMRFPGHEQVKKVKGVPDGWRTLRFSELCEFQKGKTPDEYTAEQQAGYLPYINVEFIEGQNTEYVLRKKNSIVCDDGDVLMLMDGARSGLVFRAKRGIVGSTFAKVETNLIYRDYIFEFLKASRERIVSNNTGSAIPHANKEFIHRLVLFLPTSDDLIIEFNSRYQNLFLQALNLQLQNELLMRTRDALLPRLISGKLSVENLDIQFPPSMEEAA